MFLRFLRSLLITNLITVSLEKKVLFGKSLEIVLKFGFKSLCEP